MTTATGPATFVGRQAELAALLDRAARADAGMPGVLLITGDAGVGKSRLVGEGITRLSGSVRVALGGCVDIPGVEDAQLPFGPFVEALRYARADETPAALPATAAAAVEEWLRPRAIPRPGSAESDPVHARFSDFLAVTGELSADLPLLLVLEDLHWADRSSLALLVFLARNLIRERLLLLATLRPPQPGSGQTLEATLDHLVRLPCVSMLEVSPLAEQQIRELVRFVAPQPPSDDAIATILARAEGNPLAAYELAANPVEDPAALPRTLATSVRDRLRRVSGTGRTALAAAAVLGDQAEHDVLDRLLALTLSEVDAAARAAAVREAASTGLLVARGSGYRFRHGLDREVVYADLWPDERRAMHAGAAAVLADAGVEGAPGRAAEVAAHWLSSGDRAAALQAALVAARAAAALSAFPEALAHFENALGLWPTTAAQGPDAGLMIEAAQAARWGGRLDRALDLLDAAIAASRTREESARAWERLGWYRREAGDAAGAMAAYEQALEAIGEDRESADAARVLATHAAALMIAGQYSQARERGQAALAAAEASGLDEARASALITLGVVEAMTGDAEQGLALLHRGGQVARACGSQEQRWRSAVNTSYVLRNTGHRVEAVDVALAAIGEAPSRGPFPPIALLALSNAAETMLLLGRWEEADALLARGLAVRSNPYDATGLLIYRAQLSLLRGDIAGSTRYLAEAAALAPEGLHPNAQADRHRVAAEVALASGDVPAARREVDAAFEGLEGTEEAETVLSVLTVAGRIEADAGGVPGLARPDRVQRLEGLLATATADVGAAIVEAELEVLLCRAELDRAAGADDPTGWLEVAESARRQQQPYREAYARLRQGEAALRARDRRTATEALQAAGEIAGPLGAQPLADDVERAAARGRLVLDDASRAAAGAAAVPPRAGERGLTAREVEVLRLLLDGRSNRQVARTLGMSEKTASVHVSRILTKLGVSTRGEAAAAATRLRLLEP